MSNALRAYTSEGTRVLVVDPSDEAETLQKLSDAGFKVRPIRLVGEDGKGYVTFVEALDRS